MLSDTCILDADIPRVFELTLKLGQGSKCCILKHEIVRQIFWFLKKNSVMAIIIIVAIIRTMERMSHYIVFTSVADYRRVVKPDCISGYSFI